MIRACAAVALCALAAMFVCLALAPKNDMPLTPVDIAGIIFLAVWIVASSVVMLCALFGVTDDD